jgi:hypothetical protein
MPISGSQATSPEVLCEQFACFIQNVEQSDRSAFLGDANSRGAANTEGRSCNDGHLIL